MLSHEQNARLTRVGPGTPMGTVLREYWLPAVVSEEVIADAAPLRVKLLGEDLIAYRDSVGRVGLLGDHCPHRGASLFFGRYEELYPGLRCVYHGWKFDIDGQCIDMPNEPPESDFKTKVRHTAYPCLERNGVVWTYMGPRATPPPLPDLEWNLVPDHQRFLTKRVQACNWAQAVEGGIDPSHSGFLHAPLHIDLAALTPRDRYRLDKRPRFALLEQPYGLRIGTRRIVDAATDYWSVTHFMMPFYNAFNSGGGGERDPSVGGFAWVPMDDTTTMAWCCSWNPNRDLREDERGDHPRVRQGVHLTESARLPASTAPGGAWRPKANRSNDYLLDRHIQRTQRFSGVPGISTQDAAVQESMRPIADRSIEHLGSSDSAVIRVRRMWLAAADAALQGLAPAGVDAPQAYRVRAAHFLMPNDADWTVAAADWVTAQPGSAAPIVT